MDPKMKIAVLGLGAMGSRMAARWLDAGYEVVVWNRTAEKAGSLASAGTKVAATPLEAASGAEAVVSMVRDNEASRSVWLDSETGALKGMQPDSIAIESSTLMPDWIRDLADAITGSGVRFIEAPVLGTRPQAEGGQLVYLIGGERDDLEKSRSLFEVTSGAIHYVGPTGMAAAMKLAVNALYGTQVAIWAEILAMLGQNEIDAASAVEVLNTLPTTSPALQMAGKMMAARNYTPMFPIELVAKDFDYARRLAESAGLNTPVLEAVGSTYSAAKDKGHGDDNIVGIRQLYDG
jgi:3-hydroxyisobutyrate dehydrogenase-like beta-hydroxyacid dehydrogenase